MDVDGENYNKYGSISLSEWSWTFITMMLLFFVFLFLNFKMHSNFYSEFRNAFQYYFFVCFRWVSKLIRKRHDSSVTSVAWHPDNVCLDFLIVIFYFIILPSSLVLVNYKFQAKFKLGKALMDVNCTFGSYTGTFEDCTVLFLYKIFLSCQLKTEVLLIMGKFERKSIMSISFLNFQHG